MIKTLFNPFEKFPETVLFFFGVVMLLAGSYAGYYFNGRFDGVVDFHISPDVLLTETLLDNTINTLSLFLFLFMLAKIINRKTRVIDILNASLIARIPFYISPLFNAGGALSDAEAEIMASFPAVNLDASQMTLMLIMAIVAIASLVWFVILLYNGFKVASNSKETIHKLYFALAIIAAEILSKILIYTID